MPRGATMDVWNVTDSLESQGEVLASLLLAPGGPPPDWRPAPDRWSMVEIASHLADEEREDFRARIRATLEDPAAAWPGIDPAGWAKERDYRSRELLPVVEDFRRERADSVAWLRANEELDLSLAHAHPKLGTLRVGDLLAAWAAHDLLHLGQIERLRMAWLEFSVGPYHVRYAKP